MAVITGGQSGTAPICTANPTISVKSPATATVQVCTSFETSLTDSPLGTLNALTRPTCPQPLSPPLAATPPRLPQP